MQANWNLTSNAKGQIWDSFRLRIEQVKQRQERCFHPTASVSLTRFGHVKNIALLCGFDVIQPSSNLSNIQICQSNGGQRKPNLGLVRSIVSTGVAKGMMKPRNPICFQSHHSSRHRFFGLHSSAGNATPIQDKGKVTTTQKLIKYDMILKWFRTRTNDSSWFSSSLETSLQTGMAKGKLERCWGGLSPDVQTRFQFAQAPVVNGLPLGKSMISCKFSLKPIHWHIPLLKNGYGNLRPKNYHQNPWRATCTNFPNKKIIHETPNRNHPHFILIYRNQKDIYPKYLSSGYLTVCDGSNGP